MSIRNKSHYVIGISLMTVFLAIMPFSFMGSPEDKTIQHSPLLTEGSKDLGWGNHYDHFYVHHWPDPVNVRNGNLFLYYRDLFIQSIGIPIRLERVYNSRSVYQTPLGYGWTFTYNVILNSPRDGVLTVFESDGSISTYHQSGKSERGEVFLSEGGRSKIIKSKGAGGYIRTQGCFTTEYFDPLGRLVALSDRNGNRTILEYDREGRLVSVKDPAHRQVRFEYTSDGLIKSIKYSLGRDVKYEYDNRKNLIAFIDSAGNRTRYFYDDLHNLIKMIYPNGSQTLFNYDRGKDIILSEKGPGRKKSMFSYSSKPGTVTTTVTNSLGQKTNYIYENLPHGLRFTVVDPGNRRLMREYDEHGNLIKQIDKNGLVSVFTYDDMNRLTRTTDPSGGVTEIAYCEVCPDGLIGSITDPLGKLVERHYDERGNLIAVVDPNGHTTRMIYNEMGNLITVVDKKGSTTRMKYDRAGNLIEIENPLGHKRRLEYDEASRLISVVDTKGNRTTIAYDKRDRLVALRNAKGFRTALEHDEMGKLRAFTSPEGRRVQYTYHEAGGISKITDGNGNHQEFQYDSEGNLIEAFDYNRNRTRLFYDAQNRIEKAEDAHGNTTSYHYDRTSNIVSSTDPLGNSWGFQYDKLFRITGFTDPKGIPVRMEYDERGNIVSVINELNEKYHLNYDAADRLLGITDPSGQSMRLTYDPDGNLTGVFDENNHQISAEFDPLGRIVKYVDQLGNVVSYQYDSENNLDLVKNRRGDMIKYEYDAINRLVKMEANARGKSEFEYDADGNITSTRNDNAAYRYKYDGIGRMVEKKNLNYGASFEYEYDPNGNRTLVSSQGKALVRYEYNRTNRIRKVKNRFAEEFEFSYNRLGLRERLRFPNGIVAEYRYHPSGALSDLVFKNNGGKALRTYRYEYDTTGNLSKCIEDGSRTTDYEYDKQGKLTKIVRDGGRNRSYVYDRSGNRIRMEDSGGQKISYHFNAMHQLTGAGGQSLKYDRDGNLISKTDGDGVTRFFYDSLNFLSGMSSPKSGEIVYGYGPLGERVSKKVNGKARVYIHDNEDVLWVLDEKGKVLAEYTHGPGFDAPLSMRSGNKSYFFHADRLGSIVLITDKDGNIVNRYTYDPFGEFEERDERIENIYGFNGKQYDHESGLYYFFNRHYDPNSGRFVQEDPLQISAIESNLYVYVGSNPLNRVDSLGLEWKGLVNWVMENVDFGSMDNVKKKDPRQLAEDCGTSGSPYGGGLLEPVMEWVNKNLSMDNVKKKDPRQLAEDCGTSGKTPPIDGTWGVRVGAGLRGSAEVSYNREKGSFNVTGKVDVATSVEAKVYIDAKGKGTSGPDAVAGTNVGPVNWAAAIDKNGNPQGELNVKTGPVTVRARFGEEGQIEGGRVEIGPSVSVPVVRGTKEIGRTQTTVEIPGYNKINNAFNKVVNPSASDDCE
jgi:RHS repeat-associated protein